MALGNLILEETGSITGVRVLSTDSSGTTLEVCLQTQGTIRGIAQTTFWTYTQLIRPDGSIYGGGQGLMTTTDGDVLQLTGHGSGQAPPPGGSISFRTMLHPYSTSPKYADLNTIGLAGEYNVAPDGTAVNKCWEWS